MLLYLMRHGQTDWNEQGLVQGASDIPMNDTGRGQARQAAEALKDIPFDLVLTSPLSRARETAELVTAGRNIPIRVSENLKEMSFGIYEGKTSRMYPGIREIFLHPERYVPIGGESFEDLDKRCRAFLHQAAELEGQYSCLLVCTHGAAIRGLLRAIQNTPVRDFWAGPSQPNCAVNLLQCRSGKFYVLRGPR